MSESTLAVSTKPSTLEDAITIIVASRGKTTIHLRGEPGIGKTYIGSEIAKMVTMPFIYVDCPGTDISEAGIPIPDHETKTVRLYPSEHWGLHLGVPVVIMLDEISKCPPALQAILHPLLTHPRRIGSTLLHPDSIVITTGNLTSDGVGDMMKGHTVNRIVSLTIGKPTADEWIKNYAVHNNIHPVVMAWVKRETQVMQSYRDLSDGDTNPYIYNPKTHNGTGLSYVSPRSLETASHFVWDYKDNKITERQLMACLEGALGREGAQQLATFISLETQIPSPDDIRNNPETAIVPGDPAAVCLVMLSAVQWVKTRDDVSAWFKYITRKDPVSDKSMFANETQALFVLNAREKEDLKEVMESTSEFGKWAVGVKHLFGM
jgi:hypothetical protein